MLAFLKQKYGLALMGLAGVIVFSLVWWISSPPKASVEMPVQTQTQTTVKSATKVVKATIQIVNKVPQVLITFENGQQVVIWLNGLSVSEAQKVLNFLVDHES